MDKIPLSALPPDPILKRHKPKATPGQIKPYNNRMDRMELLTLLNHLSPKRRIEYLAWVCSQVVLPGTFGLHPAIAPETKKLADDARHCDRANERLTVAIMMDISHLAIDFAGNFDECVDHLILMARNKT